MPKIHQKNGLKFIRISELPERYRAEFQQWMIGQTRPWIDGLEPQDAVWPHDYQRWKEKKKSGWEVWD